MKSITLLLSLFVAMSMAIPHHDYRGKNSTADPHGCQRYHSQHKDPQAMV